MSKTYPLKFYVQPKFERAHAFVDGYNFIMLLTGLTKEESNYKKYSHISCVNLRQNDAYFSCRTSS